MKLSKYVYFSAVLILSHFCMISLSQAQQMSDEEIKRLCPDGAKAGEFIIKFKQTNALQQMSSSARTNYLNSSAKAVGAGAVLKQFPSISSSMALVKGDIKQVSTNLNSFKLQTKSSSTPQVEYIYPNCIVKLQQAAQGVTVNGTLRLGANTQPENKFFLSNGKIYINGDGDISGLLDIKNRDGTSFSKISMPASLQGSISNFKYFYVAPQFRKVIPVGANNNDDPKVDLVALINFYSASSTSFNNLTTGSSGGLVWLDSSNKGYKLSNSVELYGIDLFNPQQQEMSINSADLNNDGQIEVVSTGKIFSRDKDKNVKTIQLEQDLANIRGVEIFDVDGDGRKDIIFGKQMPFTLGASIPSKLLIYKNNGNLNFSKQEINIPSIMHRQCESCEPFSSGYDLSMIASGDINGDGTKDIITTDKYKGNYFIYTNDGKGNFTPYTMYLEGLLTEKVNAFGILSMNLVDLNNDGIDETIFLANITQGDINGHYLGVTYSLDGQTLITNFLWKATQLSFKDGVTIADANNDGKKDIIVSTFGDQNNTQKAKANVLINNSKKADDFIFTLDESYNLEYELGPLNTNVIDSNILPNMPLVLRASGGATYRGVTDENGNFSIKKVPSGSYDVYIEVGGNLYSAAQGSKLTVANSTINNLNVTAKGADLSGYIAPPNAPNDEFMYKLWGLHNSAQDGGVADVDIDAPEAWTLTKGTKDVLIGVVDGGVDVIHPDLAKNIWVNPKEIPNNGIDDDKNGFIDDINGYDVLNQTGNIKAGTHGTHVAGTIAGVGDNNNGVVGVAPNVSIVSANVFPVEGSNTSTDAILSGVDYMLKLKLSGYNLRAINMSLGGPGDCINSPYNDLFQALDRADIMAIISAGNDTNDNDTKSYRPANCSITNSNVVTVASVDRDGQISDFSNFGVKSVNIAAPGKDILSTYPNGEFESIGGTSMAAPHVAGIAGLAFSLDPNLTAAQLKDIMLNSIKPLASFQGKIMSPGVISAKKVLDAVLANKNKPTPTPSPVPTAQPTAQPTVQPTVQPTAQPTPPPAPQPSVSPSPTSVVIPKPTLIVAPTPTEEEDDGDDEDVVELIAPGKPRLRLNRAKTAITVSWNDVAEAEEYEVYRSTKSSSLGKKIATVENIKFVDSLKQRNRKLLSGKLYYRIIAVAEESRSRASSASMVNVKR
jgi:subtilisin family serine protease